MAESQGDRQPGHVEQTPSEPPAEYAEDLLAAGDGAQLPDWVEEHFTKERAWWRLVRRLDEK
ncbi:hypothetical protein HWD35_21500 [Tsukamurella tyrosinosolvens]|uniref:hypothetical protein n=1 Tax=Tsukamurella tyrosinosolvens TaxID=57704 RepID=UPI001CE0EE15|nr:hypothetical protein [Tsukamurella tyrosinosolvens]MCA4997303.1 hypothetical protein [Tsukamurella tyrosinosolvens]